MWLRSLVLALSLFATPVLAQESCEAWQPIAEKAEANGVRLIEVAGADKDRFLTWYNAAPPASNLHPEHLFVRTAGNVVFLAFVNGGCVTTFEQMPAEIFFKFLTEEPESF